MQLKYLTLENFYIISCSHRWQQEAFKRPNPGKPGSSRCPDEHITWTGFVNNISTTAVRPVREYKSNFPPPSITSSRNTAPRFLSAGLCMKRSIWLKAALSHIMSYNSTSDGADTKLLLRSLCTVLKNGLLPLIMSDRDWAPPPARPTPEDSSELAVKCYTSSLKCKNKLSLADNVP